MISQLLFYNTETTLLKILHANSKNYAIASGFYDAEIKIMPPHPEVIFR